MRCPFCDDDQGYYYMTREAVGAAFGTDDACTLGIVDSSRQLYCQSCKHKLTRKEAGVDHRKRRAG
jgi:hypothetical protein